jgi:hypothetical protein
MLAQPSMREAKPFFLSHISLFLDEMFKKTKTCFHRHTKKPNLRLRWVLTRGISSNGITVGA